VPDDAKGSPIREREREKRAEGRVRHPLLYWSWPSILSATPVELMRARLLREGRIRDAALVGVLAYAGLRPAEAMTLRWSAIGADSIVVEPLPRARAAGSRPRQVPLWPPLADDLEAWRRESDGGGRRFVFFAPGKPWGVDLQDWRTNVYPELARDVGIDDPAPGGLRTVYCALLIDAGVPVDDVAELVDMEAASVENAFQGLLMHERRSPWRPVEQAIAKARAAAAGLAETPLDSREAFL
jgi:integrase